MSAERLNTRTAECSTSSAAGNAMRCTVSTSEKSGGSAAQNRAPEAKNKLQVLGRKKQVFINLRHGWGRDPLRARRRRLPCRSRARRAAGCKRRGGAALARNRLLHLGGPHGRPDGRLQALLHAGEGGAGGGVADPALAHQRLQGLRAAGRHRRPRALPAHRAVDGAQRGALPGLLRRAPRSAPVAAPPARSRQSSSFSRTCRRACT